MSNQVTGSYGEQLAAEHLLERGFKIVNRNVRIRRGEIDIIAIKAMTLHFVEVKTRIGDGFGKPYEAVNYYKLTHMLRAARLYVLQNRFFSHKLSLDVMSIILNSDKTMRELQFFENITL